MEREFSKEEYQSRIAWLIWSRIVLMSLVAGSLFLFERPHYPFRTSYTVAFLVVVYGLSLFYWYLLKTTTRLSFLAYLQTSIDILLVTALIHLTGGIDSGFTLLYHLAIISASIMLYRRGGYLAASLSSILYGAMLDMQFYNMAGFVRSQNFTAPQVLYQVFISILSFYLVAFLSGTLSERLRKTRQELQEKTVDFEDLRVLQEHILRSVGSGICTLDLQGEIASWNPSAEQITGYDAAEIRLRWKDVFGEAIKNLFGHTDTLKERPFRFDAKIVKKNGDTVMLGMTATLLKDEAGTVRGIIITFQDITKIVEMQEQVRRQERLASIGSLAAGIAHEIRNPLASVSGSVQVLRNELELKDENRNLMDIVVKETDRLNTIISDFLEYARPRSTQLQHIELGTMLDETILLLKNSKEFSENISVKRYGSPHMIVPGDAQRLRQVFWNLLINACQAMPSGGEITISAVPCSPELGEGAWGQIIIADTGSGIARENLNKIFEPFFTTKPKGTGLGLAIAYRIIQDHDGSITLDSEVGKGTTVAIMLPLLQGGKER